MMKKFDMQRCLRVAWLAGTVAAVTAAHAEWRFEYMDGKECSVGGDVQVRLTRFDRDVASQDGALANGPALEYLRVRERVWGCFDLAENAMINVRLVNRWQYFSSRHEDNSAQDGSRWTFPDELVVDQLNLTVDNIMNGNWSAVIGRQDIMLGNGMVILEGTPYDQGRTIYFDGITAKYQDGCNTLTLLALYNEWKDSTVFVNDQNRRLRRGDTGVFGAYWTHNFSEVFNTDVYGLWIDIDDDRDGAAEPDEYNHDADENARFAIVGARVFGSPHEQIDYSLEMATQRGKTRANDLDMTGTMIDARLTLKAGEGVAMAPSLDLQYSMFSGDDPASNDEYEGWHMAFAEYPVWREELLPITFNANWSNLSQYRTALNLQLADTENYNLKCQIAAAHLTADYGENGTGGGSVAGQIYSAFADLALKKYPVTFALEMAQFEPGNYFNDGHTADWVRLQAIYTF